MRVMCPQPTRLGRARRAGALITRAIAPGLEGGMDIERLATAEAFGSLGSEALKALVAHGAVRRLHDGDELFRRGDADRNLLYILSEGRVALSDGNGAITTCDAVSLLGLSSYFDDEPYSLTATAIGSCQVIEIPLTAVRELEIRHPALADTLSHAIAERIRAGSTHARTAAAGALSRPARSAMTTPLTFLRADASLGEALRLMEARRIGSLGVLDEQDRLIGLATAGSVAHASVIEGLPSDAPLVRAVTSVPRITPDTPLWEAEEVQVREGVKHLVVMEGERPVGMLSQTNILDAVRAAHAIARHRVEHAGGMDDLRALVADVPHVAGDAREGSRDASRAVSLLSEYHLQLQRCCVELVLDELADRGVGPPPRPYALLVLGSLARRESLLNPDQDNAIIIADARPGEAVSRPLDDDEQHWFETFTDLLNRRLDEIGYEWCRGDIMARNPHYRRRLADWCGQIRHMAHYPNLKAARWCNIFLDFELLHGDATLVEALWRETFAVLGEHARLLHFMAGDDAEGQAAVGIFNRLVTSDREEGKGRVDVKRNGLRIIANGARIYALASGVRETNTVARLRGLRREGVLSADKVASVIAAHESLLDLLLTHQLAQHDNRRPPDKYIDPRNLDDMALQSLISSMRAIKRFQDRVQGVFGL